MANWAFPPCSAGDPQPHRREIRLQMISHETDFSNPITKFIPDTAPVGN